LIATVKLVKSVHRFAQIVVRCLKDFEPSDAKAVNKSEDGMKAK
jgi:hypothetical protein